MSRPLFVGSYLQITWWALDQRKEGKNSSNDNIVTAEIMKEASGNLTCLVDFSRGSARCAVSKIFCTHNVPIYTVSFVPPFSLAVNYYRIGCFKDTRNRAMPKLLGNWRHDSQAVQKCALAAEKAGYSVFGVQYAGECWSGPQAHLTYKKYGSSTRCVNGSGGAWAQDVYEIFSK